MKTLFNISLALVMLTTIAASQWVQTAGPEGGAAFAMFADGSNLYAGMSQAGVFRSTDGGATWTQKINGMSYQTTTVISKSGANLLASGTVGLYYSTDNGDNWTAATGLPAGNGVSCIAMIGTDVFAGTMGKGVYHSTDNGVTWTATNSGLPGGGATTGVGSIAAIGTTLLASATNNSILGPMYRSTNLGGSWTLANTGLPSDYSLYNSMYSDGSTVYAGGTSLYKTTNSGDNWTQADNGIPPFSGISDIGKSGSNIFAAAANYVYGSTDGGGNWTPLGSAGLPFMNMVSIEVTGSAIYAGTIANGVYKSTDNGATWTQTVTGLKARDMNNFFIDGSTLYANGNSIFKTNDGGDTWVNVRGNLKDSSSQPTFVYVNGSMLIERDFPVEGLERSTDSGATWTSIGSGLGSLGSVGMIVSTSAGLIAADNRIYRSTDNGDTWFQVDTALGNLVGFSGLYKAGSDLYAYGLEVAKSTDDGATWAWADSGMATYFGVGGFTSVGSTLFVGGGFPNKVYKSTNGGAFWTAVTSLPASGGTSQLLSEGNSLFACSPNNGIFVSTNLGTSWTKISIGLPTPNYAYSLAILGGMMYAGTSGNSVWKRPLSDVVGVEEIASVIPTHFALEQNYPNPFNPTTNFKFQVVQGGFVKLTVFDVLGREIATLVNENLHPGTYQASWDASRMSSGVYYYRLQAGVYSEMKKMLLVK
jgi:hypothetical protein